MSFHCSLLGVKEQIKLNPILGARLVSESNTRRVFLSLAG